MTHRKTNHEENIKICNLLKKKPVYIPLNIEIDEMINNKIIKETTDNHGKTVQ